MGNNHIVRVKPPQLVRKHTKVINTHISVIVKPSQARLAPLKDLRKQPVPSQSPIIEPQRPSAPVPAAATVRQKLLKANRASSHKKTTVKYVTRDINQESLSQIATLRHRGRGKIMVIVGNGPSILEVDLAKLRNDPKINILSVNTPDPRVWPTDCWAFFDSSQFRRHEDLWNGYNGLIFNSTAIKRQKSNSMQFKNHGGKGWSRDLLTGIHIGRSSVYAAMQIAAWMSYDHIYILGCDMNADGVNGKLHFYGQNPDVDPEQRKQRFAKEAVYYDNAADMMSPDERSKFTFCSDYNNWPFIGKFNKLSHRDAIAHILNHAGNVLATV